MSNRDLAMQLIDNLSEYKLGYVVAYLQGINADEIADDTFCDQLLENYENSNEKGPPEIPGSPEKFPVFAFSSALRF